MLNSLLVYQSNILQFASMYAFHQVYRYDKHLRTRKVFDRNLRWDLVCEEIFARTLRGASCSRAQNGEHGCFLCGNTRRYANACQLQQSLSAHNPNFRPPQSNQQNFCSSNPSTSTQPHKSPADGVCYDFNKKQDAGKQTAHSNTCAGNANRNSPAKCAPSKTKQTSSFVNNPVNKNFLHFNKVKLNNYDTNVNDNNLSSNIIINDPDTRQNTDSLSGDFIIFRHGSPCESRSQTIVFDNHIQDEENLNNEQPFMN